jgi:hypothetical protein
LSFYREVAIQSTRLVLVVACSFYSVELVAASQIIVYVVALALNQIILNRLVGLTIGDMLRASVRSFVVTIVSAAGPVLVTIFYAPTQGRLWTSLLLAAMTSLIGWLAAVFAVGHPARNEIAIFFRKAVSLRVSPHRA